MRFTVVSESGVVPALGGVQPAISFTDVETQDIDPYHLEEV